MRERMRRFMIGRYGTDQLGRFTMGVGVVSLLLYTFTGQQLFNGITWICLICYYYRAMSRNRSKRYEENLQFLNLKNRVFGRLNASKHQMEQMKDYRFYKCPQCKQKVRIPKGHGKIEITCPRCRSKFVRKS